jgi:flavorubredoxin
MFDHPDLRALMADFTQSILSFKPEDTIAFSSKFFASYSAKTRAGKFLPEYRDKVNTPKH